MEQLTSAELRNYLRESVLQILFVKKDGTERQIKCTLQPDVIEGKFSTTPPNENASAQSRAVAVYDLEKDAWRSIIVENIISYSFVT